MNVSSKADGADFIITVTIRASDGYNMLFVSAGTLNTAPSRSFVTRSWQHNRDLYNQYQCEKRSTKRHRITYVSVRPHAKSSISSSSSVFGGSLSNSSCDKMT
jgi:hypothetical protein